VLVAAASPPVKYFSFFLKSLLETVRINIGECVAAAYSSLTLQAATKILMFDTEEVSPPPSSSTTSFSSSSSLTYTSFHAPFSCPRQGTLAFIAEQYPSWTIADGAIHLTAPKSTKSEEIPSMKLISQNLSYATELERIV
jgi:hypothetical protein